MQSDAEGRPFYTPKQAGEKLDTSKNTIYAAIREGQIPSFRVGRKILIPKAAFDRLLLGEK